jgi:hypothetical protein
MRAVQLRELAIVVVIAGAGVLIVAAVVLGPTVASAHSGADLPRVVQVLQPAQQQP